MHDTKTGLKAVESSWHSSLVAAQSSQVSINPDGSGVPCCLRFLAHPAVSRYQHNGLAVTTLINLNVIVLVLTNPTTKVPMGVP
jgi:hypothetical protein